MFINRLFSLFGRQVKRGKSHARSAGLLLVASSHCLRSLRLKQPRRDSTTDFYLPRCRLEFNRLWQLHGSRGLFHSYEGYCVCLRPGRQCNIWAGHQDYNGTFTNLNTGYSLPENGQKTILFDNQAGTRMMLGLFVRVSIPGGGVAILDAGNLTIGRMALLSLVTTIGLTAQIFSAQR